VRGRNALLPFRSKVLEHRGRKPRHSLLLDADIYARIEIMRRGKSNQSVRLACQRLVDAGYVQLIRRRHGDILWEPVPAFSGKPPFGEARLTLAQARRLIGRPKRIGKPAEALALRYFDAKRTMRVDTNFCRHCMWLIRAYTEAKVDEAQPLTVIRIQANGGAMLYTEGRDGLMVETEYRVP